MRREDIRRKRVEKSEGKEEQCTFRENQGGIYRGEGREIKEKGERKRNRAREW